MVLTVLFSGDRLSAAPVDANQAKAMAESFLRSASQNQRQWRAPALNQLSLAYTQVDQTSGKNAFFVFNCGQQKGYVMVAADDRAPAILGYADKGAFDGKRIPQSMKGMIHSWTAQIAWLANHNDCKAYAPMRPVSAVEPLLGDIMWDQGDPYNRKCPIVTQYDSWGYEDGTGPAATGCVATALSQIMYYTRWPEVGKDSISYTSEGEDDKVDVNVVFDGYHYNWDAMLPQLTSKSPSDAIDAVSTLMYHVGAAVQSVYGYSTGAYDFEVAPAMMKYFSYDKGISYNVRDYFTAADWDAMLQNELVSTRPVAYGGVTRKGEGHFFVVDGINDEGLYHINWGWSGTENGYYMLTLLQPGTQGIGGSSDGSAFSYAQCAVAGLQKPVEGSEPVFNFTCDGVEEFNNTIGRNEAAQLEADEIWNNSANADTANLGFALIDAEGKVAYRQLVYEAVSYPVTNGQSTMKCSFTIPADVKAGEYTVRPFYQVSYDGYATDRFMQVMPGRMDQYHATVTDDNITYTTTGAYQLSIVSVKGDNEGDLENGVTKKVTVTVHNDGGEFYGPLYLRMYIYGKKRDLGTNDFPSSSLTKAPWLSIPANADTEITYNVGDFDLPGSDDYVVELRGAQGLLSQDDNGRIETPDAATLCSLRGIKVVGSPIPPVLEVADDIIITSAVDGKVPKNDLSLKVCLNNDGGEWTGKLKVEIYDEDEWETVGDIEYDTITIAAETHEQWFTLSGGVLPDECEVGRTYELHIVDPTTDEAMIPSDYAYKEFTVGDAVDKVPNLKLESTSFDPENIVDGEPTTVVFHVSNSGYRYAGDMSFTVSRDGEVVFTSEKQPVDIDRDDEADVEFTETFDLPTASDYVFTLNDSSKEVGKVENVAITADEPKLSLTDETAVPETIENNTDTELKFCVRNDGYLYNDDVACQLVDDQNNVILTTEKQNLNVKRNEEQTLTFTVNINVPVGTACKAVLLDADNKAIGERSFEVGGVYDGIRSLLGNADVVRVAVYNANGRLVSTQLDIDSLPQGIYVIHVVTRHGEKNIKLIK